MPIVAYLVRIELRRRRWSLVVLAVVVAAVVGTVLASLAGARRAETAFDRYLAGYNSPAAAVFAEDPSELARLDDLDPVEDAIDFELVGAIPAADPEAFYPLVVSEDGVLPFERMHAPVVDGRYPERQAPFEVAVSEHTAQRLGLGVGDEWPLDTYSPQRLELWEAGGEVEPDGPPVSLQVVGIVRDPIDLGGRQSDLTMTFLTPAFRDAVPPREVGSVGDGTMVALKDGYDLSDLHTALDGTPVELDASFSPDSAQKQITPTVQAIATSTRLFGLVAALAGLIALGQAITRLHVAASADDPTLEALGASRRARWHRLFLPVALASTIGAILGVGVAVALSVLFPLGLARKADPDLGLDIDGWILGAGLVASVLVLAAMTAILAAWRVRQPHLGDQPAHLSRMGRAMADLGAPPAAVTGLSLAAGTPGRPGRIAVGGTLLSVLGVLAALVFSASIDRLVDDHALYGWGWDAEIEGAEPTDVAADGAVALGQTLDADPDVEAAATVFKQLPVAIDDKPLFAIAVTGAAAALQPVMVRGTGPSTVDEVAVGRDDLDALGAEIGDEVRLTIEGQDRPVRISGVAVLPVSADGGSSASGVYLGPGTDEALLERACDGSNDCFSSIAVALRDGADLEAFVARYEDEEANIDVPLPIPPGEVDRLTAVEDLPRYLAIFLAGLAAAAISFATATTIRQRRRDLAVLRVLGMTGRHVRTVVVVLVFSLTAAGALLGGVLGLVVGRQVWRAVANSVSLPFAPSLPLLAAVLVPLGAMLLAQVVASTSRRAAGRTPAALVLRTE